MLIFLRDFLSKILNQILSTLAESPTQCQPKATPWGIKSFYSDFSAPRRWQHTKKTPLKNCFTFVETEFHIRLKILFL